MKNLACLLFVGLAACVASAPAAGPTQPTTAVIVSEGDDAEDGDAAEASAIQGELDGGAAVMCPAGGACDWECSGGGCDITCAGGSTCNVECSGGGCALTCAAGAICNLACSGGGCDATCATGAVCNQD